MLTDCMACVPLIVGGSGVLSGVRSNSLVSTLDQVPLLYQTSQVEPPLGLQGQNIRYLLNDPAATLWPQVFSEMMGRTTERDQRYKYAYYASGEAELYDLQEDPNALVNLAGQTIIASVETGMQASLLAHGFLTINALSPQP